MSEQQQPIDLNAMKGKLATMSKQELTVLKAFFIDLLQHDKKCALLEYLEEMGEINRHLLQSGPNDIEVQNEMAEWRADLPKKIDEIKSILENLESVEGLQLEQSDEAEKKNGNNEKMDGDDK